MTIKCLVNFTNRLYLIIGFVLLSFINNGFAQEVGKNTSSHPLIMGPVLKNSDRVSGNFGELRSSHFHSGIDYKTDGKEGLPVFAAADGYVSRIKTSSQGFGKALYITHPNAIVTVYGHLRKYMPAIDDTIRKLQDSYQEYEQELFPDSGFYIIRKGDLIGYSGNTGSSEGPHLHFETRHRDSEKPFNPELAGYAIADTISPVIKALAIYQPGFAYGLAGSSKSIIENDSLCNEDTLILPETFFAGFEAFDQNNLDDNLIGIRKFSLFLDDSLIFSATIDSFAFEETRMINAFIDYPFSKTKDRKFIICHAIKGNLLSFVKQANGIIILPDTLTHHLKLKVEDTAGNTALLAYFIRKGNFTTLLNKRKKEILVKYGTDQKISFGNFKLHITPKTFYEDTWISAYEKNIKFHGLVSPVVVVEPPEIAIHKSMEISIKAGYISPSMEKHIIAVQIDSAGQKSGISAVTSNGWTTFKIRNTGMFALQIDTVAPETGQPDWEMDDYSGFQRLNFTPSVDISGIGKIRCFINDCWIPAPYSARNNRITIFPEEIPATDEAFNVRIEVTDNAGNTGNSEYRIKYQK